MMIRYEGVQPIVQTIKMEAQEGFYVLNVVV